MVIKNKMVSAFFKSIKLNSEFLVALALVAVAMASRFVPHPPNFSLVLGTMVFCGWAFKQPWMAFFVPLVGVFISDLIIGTYEGMIYVYAAYILSIYMGKRVGQAKLVPVAAASFFSSAMFFIFSNLGVWMYSGLYEKSAHGLWMCFVMALPFFHHTLLSTLLSAGVLFIIGNSSLFAPRGVTKMLITPRGAKRELLPK